MQEMTALEVQNRLGDLLKVAQRQPVAITENGQPAAVVISAEDYQRRRQSASQRLDGILQQAAFQAEQNGLTEQKLKDLLEDES
jgi:prevent-host-death family protein